MRIVLMPNNPENEETHKNNEVFRFAYEYMEGSGNIHIINTDIIDQLYDTVNGDVIVWYNNNTKDIIEDYNISSIEDL